MATAAGVRSPACGVGVGVMNTDLVFVFVLLVAAVAMFAIGKPRMDVVALLMIVWAVSSFVDVRTLDY